MLFAREGAHPNLNDLEYCTDVLPSRAFQAEPIRMTTDATTAKMRPNLHWTGIPRHLAIQYDKYVSAMILYAVSAEPLSYCAVSLVELTPPVVSPMSLPRLVAIRALIATCGNCVFEVRPWSPPSPSPQPTIPFSVPAVMSQTHPATTSSSKFQQIFDNALKEYRTRTKEDLLNHPLAAQLQACNSSSGIRAVLHQQVQELNRSQSADERLTKWLDPTVNILCSLSNVLGEGVSLVHSTTLPCEIRILIYS